MTYHVNASGRRAKGKHARSDQVEATITVQRNDKKTIRLTIDTFFSPLLLKNLGTDKKTLKRKTLDFRCMIDSVLIDPGYDGAVFHVTYADTPLKKDALVKGVYDINVPRPQSTIAVKIIAVTGEEVLIVKDV
jgi:hypothetical protein